MADILLAFAIGFMVSRAVSMIRISLLKGKIKLYEAYVHRRLDRESEQLESRLISD